MPLLRAAADPTVADNSNDQTITVSVRDNGQGALVADGTDPKGESGVTNNDPTGEERLQGLR